MSKCAYNSIVSASEAEALKEMIFKRARERAEAMTKDVDSTYTTSIRNDIMDLARASFVMSKNPFAPKAEKEEKEEIKAVEPADSEVDCDERIKTAKLNLQRLKSQIRENSCTTKEEIMKQTLESAMSDARKAFERRQTFMGALNFLNSQASIALVQKGREAFEAVA